MAPTSLSFVGQRIDPATGGASPTPRAADVAPTTAQRTTECIALRDGRDPVTKAAATWIVLTALT